MRLWETTRFLARWKVGMWKIMVLFPSLTNLGTTSKEPRAGIRTPCEWQRTERKKVKDQIPHCLPQATPHLCDTCGALGGAFWGEFPAFQEGNKGDGGANPPGAAGGVRGCRLTPHPKRFFSLESKKKKSGHAPPLVATALPSPQDPRYIKSHHIPDPKKRPPQRLVPPTESPRHG